MLVDNIKFLAKERNISIRKLERDLNFGNGTIPNWQKSQPTLDKLKSVAEYFNVSIDYLLGQEEVLAAGSSSAPTGISPYEEKLVSASRQLNEEGQDKLMDYALDLISSDRYPAQPLSPHAASKKDTSTASSKTA